MNVGVIFVAGGKSKRMSGQNKLLLKFEDEFVLMRALRIFENLTLVNRIVFSTNREIKKLVIPLVKNFKTPIQFDISEEGRPKAVYDALNCFDIKPDIVLIHDGARPFLSEKLVKKIITETIKHDAVIPTLMPNSGIIEINENGYPINLYKPKYIALAQTPQGFKFNLIKNVYEKAFKQNILNTFTDSASVLEWAGEKVIVISGEKNNFKLTTPADINRAKKLLREI